MGHWSPYVPAHSLWAPHNGASKKLWVWLLAPGHGKRGVLVVRKIVFLNWIITGKLCLVRNNLKCVGGLHWRCGGCYNCGELWLVRNNLKFLQWMWLKKSVLLDTPRGWSKLYWGGTTWNAWEVFSDVVEDVMVVEIEEVSDFWNLDVDVVRTFYWTLYAVYR